MYKENKINYKKLFEAVIEGTKELVEKSPGISLYQTIYQQLITLKERIIDNQQTITRDELYDQYSFGLIASKNFDETDYGDQLMFIYGMAYKYKNLPEN